MPQNRNFLNFRRILLDCNNLTNNVSRPITQTILSITLPIIMKDMLTIEILLLNAESPITLHMRVEVATQCAVSVELGKFYFLFMHLFYLFFMYVDRCL